MPDPKIVACTGVAPSRQKASTSYSNSLPNWSLLGLLQPCEPWCSDPHLVHASSNPRPSLTMVKVGKSERTRGARPSALTEISLPPQSSGDGGEYVASPPKALTCLNRRLLYAVIIRSDWTTRARTVFVVHGTLLSCLAHCAS